MLAFLNRRLRQDFRHELDALTADAWWSRSFSKNKF